MIGKEKIKDITISEKKGKYNEKKSNKRSVGSFDSLEFCSCGWISWSLRDFITYGKFWFGADRKYHGNGSIFSIRRVVRCAVKSACITAFWRRSGSFLPVDELYEHKYA